MGMQDSALLARVPISFNHDETLVVDFFFFDITILHHSFVFHAPHVYLYFLARLSLSRLFPFLNIISFSQFTSISSHLNRCPGIGETPTDLIE